MAPCLQALRREHPAIWAPEPERAGGGGEVGREGSEGTWGPRTETQGETETQQKRH